MKTIRLCSSCLLVNREHCQAWEIPQTSHMIKIHLFKPLWCSSRIFCQRLAAASEQNRTSEKTSLFLCCEREWCYEEHQHRILLQWILLRWLIFQSFQLLPLSWCCRVAAAAWLSLTRPAKQFQLFLLHVNRLEKEKIIIISEAHFWWWLVNKATLKIVGRRRSALESLVRMGKPHVGNLFTCKSYVISLLLHLYCLFLVYSNRNSMVIQW